MSDSKASRSEYPHKGKHQTTLGDSSGRFHLFLAVAPGVALTEMWWGMDKRDFFSPSPALHAVKQTGQERAFGVIQP